MDTAPAQGVPGLEIRKLVLKDLQQLCRCVSSQKRLVSEVGVYQWPAGGEMRAWEKSHKAAKHIVALVPKYLAWCQSIWPGVSALSMSGSASRIGRHKETLPG